MSDEQTKQLFKRAMVAAIPLDPLMLQDANEADLNAYTRLASTNYLWPIRFNYTNTTPMPSNLPKECFMGMGVSNQQLLDEMGITPDRLRGNSTPYSSILRFTMIRDDDPYGQGVPAGSVGYWTLPMINSNGKHLNSSCFIDGMGQIHGIQWEGLKSGLALTGDQDYKVEIILIGANCSWPESWDALFNGYVNAALNTVCQITNPRMRSWMQKDEVGHQAMLMSEIAGVFKSDLPNLLDNQLPNTPGSTPKPLSVWEMIAGIWRQSQNVRIAPTLPTTDPIIIRKLGNRVVEDLQATQSSSLVSVINRRLI